MTKNDARQNYVNGIEEVRPSSSDYVTCKCEVTRRQVRRNGRYIGTCRSSHQRCSVTKGVLRNFTEFTGKHLCQSLLFNNIAG